MDYSIFPSGNCPLASEYLSQAIIMDGVTCWRFSYRIVTDLGFGNPSLKMHYAEDMQRIAFQRVENSRSVIEAASRLPCVVAFRVSHDDGKALTDAIVCRHDNRPSGTDVQNSLGTVIEWHSRIPGTSPVEYVRMNDTIYKLQPLEQA